MKSPITLKNNVKQVKTILSKDIESVYSSKYKVNVDYLFQGINEITKYQCLDSNYMFFDPCPMGDDAFYQKLQLFDWYYKENKWEFDEVLKYIDKDKKVLEIGSGFGAFLQKVSKKTSNYLGLELNSNALEVIESKGLNAKNLTIQDFVKSNDDKFDVVCSFQVMEHIIEVHEIVKASIDKLNKNGLLIISVPDSDSQVLNDNYNYLNLPPHHAGQWFDKTFIELAKIFNLELVDIKYEPINLYTIYRYTINYSLDIEKKYNISRYLTFPFSLIRSLFIKKRAHTFIGIFRKINETSIL